MNELDLLALIGTIQSATALGVGFVVIFWYLRNYLAARREGESLEAVTTLWLMALGSICGIAGAHGMFLGIGVLSVVLDPADETRIYWTRLLIIVAQTVLMAVTLWKLLLTLKLDRELSGEGGD